MAYKIAVASSDGVHVDQSFGAADAFHIYEVNDEGDYHLLEIREWKEKEMIIQNTGVGCHLADAKAKGTGCGAGSGCGGPGQSIPKLELIADCRSILCSKIGFQVRKQMEKKAIAAFDIEYGVTEALNKITFYFSRIDSHRSLRRSGNVKGAK